MFTLPNVVFALVTGIGAGAAFYLLQCALNIVRHIGRKVWH